MTTVIATRCEQCGTGYAVYVTKRMQSQVLALNSDDGESREIALAGLDQAKSIDSEEQQSGEVDEAREIHERIGLHWLDARNGPGRCACGEPIDVLELLGHQIRHQHRGHLIEATSREERERFADWYLRDRGCQIVQRAREGYARLGVGALGLWVHGRAVHRQYVDRVWLEEVFAESPGSSLETTFRAYDPAQEVVVFFSWPDGAVDTHTLDLEHSCPTCEATP